MTFEKCAQELGFELNPKTGYFSFPSEEERKRFLAFLFVWHGGPDYKLIAHYLDFPLEQIQLLSQSITDLFHIEKTMDDMFDFFDAGRNDNAIYNVAMKIFIRSKAESIMEMVNHIGLEKFKKKICLPPEEIAERFRIPLHSVELLLDGFTIDAVVDDFMSMDPKVWSKLLKNLD